MPLQGTLVHSAQHILWRDHCLTFAHQWCKNIVRYCTGCFICSDTWVWLTWIFSAVGQLSNMVEHENPNYPKPGLRADESPCSCQGLGQNPVSLAPKIYFHFTSKSQFSPMGHRTNGQTGPQLRRKDDGNTRSAPVNRVNWRRRRRVPLARATTLFRWRLRERRARHGQCIQVSDIE